MPTIRLTQRAVETLKPPASGRVEYWDTHLPGFGLRVSAPGQKNKGQGLKTWFAMYRVAGKQLRETIGSLALIPKVENARERARESMRKAQAGVNPVIERRAQARAAKMPAGSKAPNNFRVVAQRYVERYAKRNTKQTTWMELQRQLKVDVFPKWADRPIASITRRDIVELLEGIAARGSPVQANRTLARLKLCSAGRWTRNLSPRTQRRGCGE